MLRKIPRKIAKALNVPIRCYISYEKMRIYKINKKNNYEELDIPEVKIRELFIKIQNSEI